MFILKIASVLDKYQIPYAIVGGYAVALHGAVRGTIDVDLITKWNLKNLIAIEKALNEIGLTSRLPITSEELFNFRDEYIKNKNLVAWNFINTQNAAEQIDVIITFDLKNASIKKIKIQEQVLNVISKKDLLRMKKKSGRDQDLIDIKALEKLDED